MRLLTGIYVLEDKVERSHRPTVLYVLSVYIE